MPATVYLGRSEHINARSGRRVPHDITGLEVVEEAAEFLFAGEEGVQFGGGRIGFDLLLEGVEFGFNAAAAEDGEAAFGFFPGGFGGRREGDFEEQAAIFFVE